MNNDEMNKLRCMIPQTYKMQTMELITGAALKTYLILLIENGEEERAKAELKAAVKPKLFSAKKSDITKSDLGFIYPEVLDTLFDTSALAELLDNAYRAVEQDMIATNSFATPVGEGMRKMDGGSLVNKVGYAFTVFFVDCYKAVCG